MKTRNPHQFDVSSLVFERLEFLMKVEGQCNEILILALIYHYLSWKQSKIYWCRYNETFWIFLKESFSIEIHWFKTKFFIIEFYKECKMKINLKLIFLWQVLQTLLLDSTQMYPWGSTWGTINHTLSSFPPLLSTY